MTGNPVGMRRVNVERARRMVARTAAASADVERRWWIASMTPEHRAVHEREYLPGFGCSFCINDAMARAAETMRRTMATGGSYVR